jgi:hypothetical protein
MNVSLERRRRGSLTTVCPTCAAEQPWSDTCRRCKTDLSDLRAAWRAIEGARCECLRELRRGNSDRALRLAQHLMHLRPDQDAARLLAICCLLHGNWRAALRWSRCVDQGADQP